MMHALPALITFGIITMFGMIAAIVWLISQNRQSTNTARTLAAQKKVLLNENEELSERLSTVLNDTEWFHLLFNNTKDMVFVYPVDEEGLPDKFLEINDAACERLGYPRNVLLTKTVMDVEQFDVPLMTKGHSPSDLAALSDSSIKAQMHRLLSNAARKLVAKITERESLTYDGDFSDSTGQSFPVEIHARAFQQHNRTMIICTVEDITMRKQAEHELSESRLRFLDFFASSPIGIAVYDSNKQLIDVNLACLKMFGIPDREQFSKFNIFDNPFMPQNTKSRLARGESDRYEAVIDFGEAIEKSVFISRKTGVAYYDVLISNMGPGEDFRPKGYFAQVQDITDRRSAEGEIKSQAEQLRQAEKMEAIGSMAGGIAHDFNNILTPIIGYAQMLQKKLQGDETTERFATGILKAANRAKELVSQILTFSRKSDDGDEQSYRPIHIIPIAKEVLVLQKTSLPENVEVERVIKTENDIVVADPTKIHQILMNLCTNAGHAMRGPGGHLEMRITDFMLTGRAKDDLRDLEPGRYLRISVKDTGTGMDKNVMARIFEPFFTTKKKGEGTGMGLSVVHGIVRSFHGAITVESEVGKGSTFHVILPLVEKEAQEREEDSDVAIPSGYETILVVDDDQDVCQMTIDMLESLGYATASTYQGNGAYRLFEIDPSRFDLVITDQVMPGITGSELVEKLLKIKPNLPIILCTGYSQALSEEQAKDIGISALMTKPIVLKELATTVRRLLDGVPEGHIIE